MVTIAEWALGYCAVVAIGYWLMYRSAIDAGEIPEAELFWEE